jgi:hypothetical protein
MIIALIGIATVTTALFIVIIFIKLSFAFIIVRPDFLKRKWISPNPAYTLRANVLALWDIALYGRNVVYAGNVRRSIDSLICIQINPFFA